MSSQLVAEVASKVLMYGTRYCPFCMRARALLESKGVAFEEILVDEAPDRRKEMIEKSGRYTVPQIWVGDEHIGGCDELYALERQGGLDERLKS
ncbi:MAG: glutaredoxin 3 [Pseudomonadales bacterium]|nr:glutaredoxin 3 [Pseudomonadales bacterium]